MKVVLLGLLAALGGTPALAADDAFLSQLVGNWIGRGTMRTSPAAPPERVYCKIANTLSEDGRALQQKGRCSLASNSGPIDGVIAAIGSNLYGGSLDSLASRGPATLSGSGMPSRIELNAEFIDTLDGKPAKSVIAIELVAGGYRLTSTRVNPKDGTPYTSSQIVFTAT